MKLRSLDDVLMEQLADLHSAETQLVEALPKVAKSASTPELRQAIEDHLVQTRSHVQRLEKAFSHLGTQVPDEHCEGMEGLLQEGEKVIETDGDPVAKDAALIAAAQRVEHYEIGAYGTCVAWARLLGHDEAASLLEQTLDEEKAADEKLSALAESEINESAVAEGRGEDEEEEEDEEERGGRPATRRQMAGTSRSRAKAADRRRK
jgi:ferritin-like metal-binding protein YciE